MTKIKTYIPHENVITRDNDSTVLIQYSHVGRGVADTCFMYDDIRATDEHYRGLDRHLFGEVIEVNHEM